MKSLCWNARGKIDSGGYGRIYMNGQIFATHRVAYILFKGRIPNNLEIDHLCRNRMCINPEHLEAVTSRVNTLRGVSIQAQNARKTHCKNGHPFIDGNLVISKLKKGKRGCLTCSRASWRKNKKIQRSNLLKS